MMSAIENYRKYRGVQSMVYWDGLMSQHCKEHCWAMARESKLYHTPEYYLGDWKEAIAMSSYSGEEGHSLCAKLIFDVLGSSPEHSKILVESNELAFGLILHNYIWYLTIRGR